MRSANSYIAIAPRSQRDRKRGGGKRTFLKIPADNVEGVDDLVKAGLDQNVTMTGLVEEYFNNIG